MWWAEVQETGGGFLKKWLLIHEVYLTFHMEIFREGIFLF